MTCSCCGAEKPESDFRPKHRQCRSCLSAKSSAWAQANREKRRAWMEREEVRLRTNAYNRKRRAEGKVNTKWSPRTPEQNERRRLTRRRLNSESAYLLSDPCAYCGSHADTIDHIVPVAGGGPHDLENYTAACRSCNSAKKDRPLLMFLREVDWSKA